MTSITTRSYWAWVRITLEILIMIALVILILMFNSPPELTIANLIVYSGEFSSFEKTQFGDGIIILRDYQNSFAINPADAQAFDEPGFLQDVKPGDILYISVIDEAARQADGSSSSVRALEVRTASQIYLPLGAMFFQSRTQQDLYLPGAIIVLGVMLVVLLVYSLLAGDFKNLAGDLRSQSIGTKHGGN